MLSRRNRLRPRSRHHRLRLTRPTSCPRSSGKSCRCCRSSFGESSKTARREALSQGTETTECVMRTMEPLRITERLRFQGDAGSYRKGRLRSRYGSEVNLGAFLLSAELVGMASRTCSFLLAFRAVCPCKEVKGVVRVCPIVLLMGSKPGRWVRTKIHIGKP